MFRSRSFYMLLSGQSLANLTDALYIVAVVSILYRSNHSAFIAATVPLVRVGGLILGGLAAPWLFGRYRLTALLRVSQGIQTLFLTGLTAISVTSGPSLWTVLLFVAALAVADGWTVPSRNALVPRLVPKQKLVRANGWISSSDQVAMLAGWSLSGILVDLFGADRLLAVAAGTMALSAVSMHFVNDPSETRETSAGAAFSGLWTGWKLLVSHPVLLRAGSIDAFRFLAEGAWSGAILLAYVNQVLQAENAWWGFINAAYMAGCILGSLAISRFADSIRHKLAIAILAGGLGMSLWTGLFAAAHLPVLALLFSLLTGPPGQLQTIAVRTLLQSTVEASKTPLLMTAHATMNAALFAVSVLIMGWTADRFSPQTPYFLAAFLYVAGCCLAPGLKAKIAERKTSSAGKFDLSP
ncbi:MFS transporter [Staphylospora marina]|uniref:MFS transporter n=1 Tax=Staphylospora marina TaxID=2490858 RepID=UPI000F5C163D|nr:MFS transporter [Staphylospora marina]